MYWSLTFVILQELELKINSLESIQSETTEKNDININEVGKQQHILTFYAPISILKFSILMSMHSLKELIIHLREFDN